MSRPLTEKQQRFADAFDGNGTEAARIAGYKGNANTLHKHAHQLMRHPGVMAAIDARTAEARAAKAEARAALIATREQRQEFWTATMNDVSEDIGSRLKASELLGKSEADFLDRTEHSGTLSVSVSINGITRAKP